MGQRSSVLIGIGIPIALVITLFTWGVIQNDGIAGKPGVNESFGETKLSTDPFSDFKLTTLDGDLISIRDYRGKIVVVDFWSSKCWFTSVAVPRLSALNLSSHMSICKSGGFICPSLSAITFASSPMCSEVSWVWPHSASFSIELLFGAALHVLIGATGVSMSVMGSRGDS